MAAENQEALAYDSGSVGRTTIGDYISVLRRRKWWILAPVVLAVGLTMVVSLTSPTLYRASATVLVTDPPKTAGDLPQSLTPKANKNELTRAQSLPVQQEARKQFGSEPMLSARSGGGNTDLFVFFAESRSADRAAKAANAYAQVYARARGAAITEALQSQIAGIDAEITSAQEELDALPSDTSADAEELNATIARLKSERNRVKSVMDGTIEANTKVLDPATPPRSSFTPRPLRDGLTAFVLSLIAGLALAFIVDALDQKLRTVRDTERATLLPVLSVVGNIRRWKSGETHLVLTEAPSSPQAEAFRALRAKIQFRRMDEPLQTVLVTSAEPADGKSSTAANLALAFAAVGDDTVLVDLDLRRPTLHDYLGLPNGPGAASVLTGGDYKGIYQTLPSLPNLTFVSAGRSRIDASELLASERLGQFLSVLTERFETVIIDSPPILAVVDPLEIAQHCDGVLLVVSAGNTDGRKARLAAEQLSDAYAPVLGALLNNYTEPGSGYGYSYDYEVVDNYVPDREPNPTLEDDDHTGPIVSAVAQPPSNRVVRTTPPSGHSSSHSTSHPTGEQPVSGYAATPYQSGAWAVDSAETADVTTPQGIERATTIESTFAPESTATPTPTPTSASASAPANASTTSSATPSSPTANAVTDGHHTGAVPAIGADDSSTGWSGEPAARYIGTLFDENSKQAKASQSPATSSSPDASGTNPWVNGSTNAGAAQLTVAEREEILLGALIVPQPVVELPLTETNGFEPLSPNTGKTNTSPTGLPREDNDEWEILSEEEMRASIRSDMAEALRERRNRDRSEASNGDQPPAPADDPTPASPTPSPSSTSPESASSPDSSSKNRRKRRL